MNAPAPRLMIREARADDYAALGPMLVLAYAELPGMPTPDQQPDYYAMLADVAARAARPSLTVFVATDAAGQLLGSIDFIADMAHYGSGGTATTVTDAVGVRLLAVNGAARGQGVGKALTRFCIGQARVAGKARVVLHTTKAMQIAWGMYEALGFVRFPAIDFRQGNLDVFGFRLDLGDTPVA
jgi:ribosomal protein S18 acetylase RimI-like enzyme